jgi:hypothetical protein
MSQPQPPPRPPRRPRHSRLRRHAVRNRRAVPVDHAAVRSDVREDRTGLPLNLAITVVNAGANCAPVTNASVEIWHCDVNDRSVKTSQTCFQEEIKVGITV